MHTTFPQTVLIFLIFIFVCISVIYVLRKVAPFIFGCLLMLVGVAAIFLFLAFIALNSK